MPIPRTFEERVDLVAKNMYEAIPERGRPRGLWSDDPLTWEVLKKEVDTPLHGYYEFILSIRRSAAAAVRTLYPDITDSTSLWNLGVVVHTEFSKEMVELRRANEEMADENLSLTLKNGELEKENANLRADLRNIAMYATTVAANHDDHMPRIVEK
jgi:hypothetical protein